MRELVEFLSLACTGTGQATFYNTREEQQAALDRAHEGVLASRREGYALAALFPMNDRNRMLIARNLLARPQEGEGQRAIEERVLKLILEALPIQRVLALFGELRDARVSNARTRRLGGWVWDRWGDDYRVVKYRDKWRVLLRHCHIPEGDDPAAAERHRWVFGRVRSAEQVAHNRLLAARLRARHDPEALFELPLDIARDMAVSLHGRDSAEFVREFGERGRTSAREALRARQTAGAEVDFRRLSALDLLRHAQAHLDDAEAVAPLVADKCTALARRVRGLLPSRVAVVVDNSASALGSAERRGQPLAVIELLARVLLAAEGVEVRVHCVGPALDGVPLAAAGATDLRRPLAEALVERPELVVILSDGYENSGAGGVAQVLATRAVRAANIAVAHLNPVAASESGGPRRLAAELPAFGVADADQLPLALLLARAWSDEDVLTERLAAMREALLKGDDDAARDAAGL